MADPRLPDTLTELADVAGWDAAWTLVREKGGTTVYIPKLAGRRHWLSRLLGIEVAGRLCAHFGGDHVTIPMASRAQRQEHWARTVETGKSLSEMAREMGAHERTASRYRARARGGRGGGGGQGSLF